MAKGECPACNTPNEYTDICCTMCGQKLPWAAVIQKSSPAIKDAATIKAEEALAASLPKIQQMFKEKVGPAIITAAKDDSKMTTFSKAVYGGLPLVVRLVVDESAFVQFCFKHRDKIIPTDSPDEKG